MFLLADAILISLDYVTDGLVVFPAVIESQFAQELPFIVTENIIMKLVGHGVSRQEAHEEIRILSRQAAYAFKMEGHPNDLIARIKNSEFFVRDSLSILSTFIFFFLKKKAKNLFNH